MLPDKKVKVPIFRKVAVFGKVQSLSSMPLPAQILNYTCLPWRCQRWRNLIVAKFPLLVAVWPSQLLCIQSRRVQLQSGTDVYMLFGVDTDGGRIHALLSSRHQESWRSLHFSRFAAPNISSCSPPTVRNFQESVTVCKDSVVHSLTQVIERQHGET